MVLSQTTSCLATTQSSREHIVFMDFAMDCIKNALRSGKYRLAVGAANSGSIHDSMMTMTGNNPKIVIWHFGKNPMLYPQHIVVLVGELSLYGIEPSQVSLVIDSISSVDKPWGCSNLLNYIEPEKMLVLQDALRSAGFEVTDTSCF